MANLISDDARAKNEEKWKEATNKVIADQLVENLEKLLNGKATYWQCSDLKTKHRKIIIEYNHEIK